MSENSSPARMSSFLLVRNRNWHVVLSRILSQFLMYLTSIRKQKCIGSWFLRQTGCKERMDIIKLIKSHSEGVLCYRSIL